jgi:hypothetical protein
MIRQARPGDTVLGNSREITGRSQRLPWWLGVEGVKTTENKIHWPHWEAVNEAKIQPLQLQNSYKKSFTHVYCTEHKKCVYTNIYSPINMNCSV